MKSLSVLLLLSCIAACGDLNADRATCQQEIDQQVRDARYDRASCVWCHELNGHEGETDCIPCHSVAYRADH